METSVESLCNLLVRSRLVTPSNVRTFHQRWKTEGGANIADPQKFAKWLVVNKALTEYQAGLLLRGKSDHFFLNDYKLLDRLGQGRLAGIYEAVHQLGQRVAIKVLPPSKVKDTEIFGRFQREARLAVKLKHPNIIRTFQMGQSEGLYYIVMEYLDGDTLEDILKARGKLPPAEAARIMHQALLGLQHIHEKGMIHRDLKPANLMLVPAPKKGKDTMQSTVKILEIGLGRAIFDEGDAGQPAPAQDLTGTGQLLGTPDYLAPEQARNAHTADIRADIYSLGCVFYHCLAGRPPFPDVNPVVQMVRHATEQPKPLKEFNPAVPDGLQQIVNWMLAKDPAQRYPTPDRAAQALQVFLASGQEAVLEAEPQMPAYIEWVDLNPEEGIVLTPVTGEGAAVAVAPPGVRAVSGADVELVGVPSTATGAPSLVAPVPITATAGKNFLLLGLGLGVGIGMIGIVGLVGWLIIKKFM